MAVKVSASASKPVDFFHLAAQTVRDNGSSEAALRTAISRAYYAVLLATRDKLFGPDGLRLTGPIRKQLGKKFGVKTKRNPGSHDLIIFAITDVEKTATLNPLTLSQQLGQLKEARVHADYHFAEDNLEDIPKADWREYAVENVTLASQLLPMAEGLPSDPHS
ncbi:MAG: hypothetical protein Q8P59_01060 [Dehalococcoidia bacterium]|nr:hypothetical protein [Dehalococcoidia bacterium]